MESIKSLPKWGLFNKVNHTSALLALFMVIAMMLSTAVVAWAQDGKQVFEGSMTAPGSNHFQVRPQQGGGLGAHLLHERSSCLSHGAGARGSRWPSAVYEV